MKFKVSILCLIMSLLFISSINVFAASTVAKDSDPNYSELKNLYNSANKINVTNPSIVTIYGKSDCNGTRCSVSYANVGGNDFRTALSRLIVCTNGEKNILYQIAGTGKTDFMEDNKEQYSGTAYWSEEYQVTCSNTSTGETNIQLNNSSSGSTNTGGTNTGNTSGNNGVDNSNGSNSGYQTSTPGENPETGVTTYFMILGLISIVSYGVMLLIKKYNLFKSI